MTYAVDWALKANYLSIYAVNQSTREVKNERLKKKKYWLHENVCEFSAYVAFNKATNGQT